MLFILALCIYTFRYTTRWIRSLSITRCYNLNVREQAHIISMYLRRRSISVTIAELTPFPYDLEAAYKSNKIWLRIRQNGNPINETYMLDQKELQLSWRFRGTWVVVSTDAASHAVIFWAREFGVLVVPPEALPSLVAILKGPQPNFAEALRQLSPAFRD